MMADTSVQGQAERWVVEQALPGLYGQRFKKAPIPLSWGGSFEFDAVSADSKIIVCVSTSCSRTATGRPAVGKYHKIRSDTLFLLFGRGVQNRVLVFTDRQMFLHFEKERARGRFPTSDEVELRYVQLPVELAEKLQQAAARASVEVSPIRGLP